jgi:hypothetical protein
MNGPKHTLKVQPGRGPRVAGRPAPTHTSGEPLSPHLTPELRSWITNVLVPAMVTEYIAEHDSAIGVAKPIAAVPQCEANGRHSAGGIQ